MGKKKQLKQADREVERLSAKLEKARARGDRWKAAAKLHEAEARESARELKRLRKRLQTPEASDASDAPAADDTASDEPAESAGPDASWSLTRLRAEARERGITGYSHKHKDELLRLLAE